MAIDYKDIGQRIKTKRVEKGFTQEQLSEMVDIGPSHMSHIESGSTVPSFDVFISILNGNLLLVVMQVVISICILLMMNLLGQMLAVRVKTVLVIGGLLVQDMSTLFMLALPRTENICSTHTTN